MRLILEGKKCFLNIFIYLLVWIPIILLILYMFAIVYLTTMMGNMSDEIKATKLPSALVISGII